MKKHLRAVTLFTGLVFIYVIISQKAFCQIIISPATAENMVANLVGPGITYSNVSFTGDLSNAAALFGNGSSTNLGLNSGVVITSGSAALVPENTSEFASLDNGGPNIPELNAIANTVTSDGFILEFDFIPLSANLNVKYIFGSEEYMEWVFQGYNDAFAFFISGPGIAGEENIATVGGQAVTINNINPLLNSQYFIDNRSSSGPNSIEYDGFTTVLTALKTVIPCSTYHIRLMVADGGDPIYDTGVFIEEGGLFTTGNRVTVAVQNTFGLPASVEGCTGGQFIFTMPAPAEANTTFYFTAGGTAVPGTDYAPLPNSITIPAGQTSAVLPVTIYDDAIAESPETLTLTVETSPCGTETFTMHITDGTPLTVSTADHTVCAGSAPLDIVASAQGGVGDISYTWDNRAGNGPTVTVQPEETTVYTVTATDQCGRVETSACTVTVTPGPSSVFTATPVVCGTEACTLTYTGTAGAGAVYTWSFDGGNAAEQNGPGQQSVTWAVPGAHTVTLSVTEPGCAGTPFSREIWVAQVPPAPEISSNSPVCEGNTLTFTAVSISGAAFFWTGPQAYASGGSGPMIEHTEISRAGQYACYVVAGGCTSEVSHTAVEVDAGLPAPQVVSNSPVCEGGNIQLSAGTVNGAGYVWSGPGGFSSTAPSLDIPSAGPAMGGIYRLCLTGAAGCVSDTVQVPVTVQPLPPAPAVTSNSPVCAGQSLSLSAGNGTGACLWTGPNGYQSTQTDPVIPVAEVSMAGTYTATRTAGGCTSNAATVEVAVNAVPVPDAGPDQTVCSGQNVFIGTQGQPAAEYSWSATQGLMGPNAPYTSAQWVNEGTDLLTVHLVLQANNAGCTASDETVITVVPIPTASFEAPAAQCLEGNSFAFAAEAGTFSPEATFHWTFTNASMAQSNEPAPQQVHYLSTVNNDATLKVSRLGCESQPLTRAVTVHGSPTANFKVLQPEGCAPLSVHFMNESSPGAGGPMAYEWQLGNGEHSESAEPAPTYNQPGEYTVKLRVENSAGCTGDITKVHVVKAYHPPVAGFTATPETVYTGEPVYINHTASGNADSYVYTVSDGGQYTVPDFSVVFPQAGTYTVYQKVTAGEGCTDLSAHEITVLEKEALFVPNAFTPDGPDGMNSTFRPVGSGVSGYSMGIYTRWGQLVFYTTDIQTGWNGHIPEGDQTEQQDVYLYRIEYRDNSQRAKTLVGTVLLLR